MLNIVIFGAPGCGKGTQSELIIEKYGLHHISTGEILRNEIQNETPLGIEAAEHIGKGHLVPDELIVEMLSDMLDKHPNTKGYIFDGFPRTLAQGEALDKMLKEKETRIATVISLNVDRDELLTRLIKRGEEHGRADDNEETIKNRLTVYSNQTEPLKEYYRKQGKLFNVKGEGSIEDIFERVTDVLNRIAL